MKRVTSHFKKDISEVTHVMLTALAIIMFWRGIWGLMDVYLFPGNFILSHVLSIIIGILILYSTENFREHII